MPYFALRKMRDRNTADGTEKSSIIMTEVIEVFV